MNVLNQPTVSEVELPNEGAATSFGLVLAGNEADAGDFAWQDITGELYQVPNN